MNIPVGRRTRRKSSLSIPLDTDQNIIVDTNLFGGTLPPRALRKNFPRAIKENNQSIGPLRAGLEITSESIKDADGNSLKQTELACRTTKDGKRSVSRRRKDKQKRGSKTIITNTDNLVSNAEYGLEKKSRRKSLSKGGSISKKESKKMPLQLVKERSLPSTPYAERRRKSSVVSLGMTMWLHKFVYKTRRSTTFKIKDEGSITAQVASNDTPSVTVVNNSPTTPPLTQNRNDKLTISKEPPKTLQTASPVLNNNQIHSWGFLRKRLDSSKIRDAFSSVKFDLKDRRIQVLRQIGEGGYSKVFEVFDEKRQLFALKVVKILDPDEEENENAAKGKGKMVTEDRILKEIGFLEIFRDAKRVCTMLDYEKRSDISLPLCKFCLIAQNKNASSVAKFVCQRKIKDNSFTVKTK